jgi:hypothetical protein
MMLDGKKKNNQSAMSLSGGYGGGYCMIKQNYGKENNNR